MTPRLTPVDILNKRFSRRISGYHPAETDEFMRQVAATLETVSLENATQREQISGMERELTRYRALESTMRDALVMGQKAADEIRDAARAQAAAQFETAQQRVDALQEQTERLRLDRRRLAHEMRALLESQMAWLEYEMARDTPQTAVVTESAAPAIFAAPATTAFAAPQERRISADSPTGELPTLTERVGEAAPASESQTQDRTALRNGASEAVLTENA